MDIHHLSKPREWAASVNYKVNYGLWVIMMCKCKKCTIQVNDVEKKEAMHRV